MDQKPECGDDKALLKEEKGVTNALLAFLSSLANVGMTEDPLVVFCRNIVRYVKPIKFACCAYEDDEIADIVACKENYAAKLPSPDVQRTATNNMRSCLGTGDVAVITDEEAMKLLPPSERKRGRCHTCCVVNVKVNRKSVAIMCFFLSPGFNVTEPRRMWLALFGRMVSAFVSRRRQILAPTENKGLSFRNSELDAWVREGLSDPRIKAIVGERGAGKIALLRAIRKFVQSGGVDEGHLVFLDFEDARFRRFKTPESVLEYLASFPVDSKPYYLFMNELGMVSYSAELLYRLKSLSGWNVWMTASSAHTLRMIDDKGKIDSSCTSLLVFRQWTNPKVSRGGEALSRIWCQIFMRDVVCGVEHPDIRAKEALAEYYSDHLGEAKSLREIAEELTRSGRTLSLNSIAVYRQALIDAYLIEISDVYDEKTEQVAPKLCGRIFWTDLELRDWRYGPLPDPSEERLALNRLYLKLRQRYDKVYTPRRSEAAFLTIEPSGAIRFWDLPK